MDYQDDGYVVQYEPGVNPDGLKQHYKLRPFENRDMYFGAFNIAIKDENGRIEGMVRLTTLRPTSWCKRSRQRYRA